MPKLFEQDNSIRAIGVFENDRPPVPWIRRLMGDTGLSAIYDPDADPGGRHLKQVRKLFPEAKIYGAPGEKPTPDVSFML